MDDEKPTSIWKKEISFRRKPAADGAAEPGRSGGSIWKKEISLRKKEPGPAVEAAVETPAPDPELEVALAALAVPEPPEQPQPQPQPAVPAVEHDWLTRPLEAVSEPPAPVSLVPPVENAPTVELPPVEPELEVGLDLQLPAEPELPAPAPEPVAAAPVPEPESQPKVPFYKKELSFKRDKAPKAAKEPKSAKEPKPAKEPRQPRQKPSLPTLSLPSLSLPSVGGGSSKKLVGLKIGGSQIAAARVVNGEAPELVQAVREPLEHGIVVGGELRDPEALTAALKDFFARHKLPKRGVRLGIASNRIGVRTFEVSGIEDPKQLGNAIRFRAQEVLPIPVEEAVLDYQVLSEGVTEDGQPLRRVLLVVAYRELVDRYVAACRKAGIQIVGIDLEAFALLRAIAEPRDPMPGSERGALVAVSVGHERSTFAVSDGRVCEFTRVLEWGGWALNVAIARALDLAPSEVEPVKRALSFAGADRAPDGFTAAQLETARDAARKQLQSFARELVSSLQFYQNQAGSLGIGQIALTGGTAHLPGLGAELERLIGVPVRVADPLARLKVSRKVREPEQVGSLAVAIGLGIED